MSSVSGDDPPSAERNEDPAGDAQPAPTAFPPSDAPSSSEAPSAPRPSASSVMGTVLAHLSKAEFAALLLLWLGWFVLPSISSFVQTLTFWDLLGMEPSRLMSGKSGHGLFAMVGLAAVAAPAAIPFANHPRKRLLLAAPAVFLLLWAVRTWWSIRSTAAKAEEAMGDLTSGLGAQVSSTAWELFSNAIDFGFWFVIGSSIFLFWQAIRGVSETDRELMAAKAKAGWSDVQGMAAKHAEVHADKITLAKKKWPLIAASIAGLFVLVTGFRIAKGWFVGDPDVLGIQLGMSSEEVLTACEKLGPGVAVQTQRGGFDMMGNPFQGHSFERLQKNSQEFQHEFTERIACAAGERELKVEFSPVPTENVVVAVELSEDTSKLSTTDEVEDFLKDSYGEPDRRVDDVSLFGKMQIWQYAVGETDEPCSPEQLTSAPASCGPLFIAQFASGLGNQVVLNLKILDPAAQAAMSQKFIAFVQELKEDPRSGLATVAAPPPAPARRAEPVRPVAASVEQAAPSEAGYAAPSAVKPQTPQPPAVVPPTPAMQVPAAPVKQAEVSVVPEGRTGLEPSFAESEEVAAIPAPEFRKVSADILGVGLGMALNEVLDQFWDHIPKSKVSLNSFVLTSPQGVPEGLKRGGTYFPNRAGHVLVETNGPDGRTVSEQLRIVFAAGEDPNLVVAVGRLSQSKVEAAEFLSAVIGKYGPPKTKNEYKNSQTLSWVYLGRDCVAPLLNSRDVHPFTVIGRFTNHQPESVDDCGVSLVINLTSQDGIVTHTSTALIDPRAMVRAHARWTVFERVRRDARRKEQLLHGVKATKL